MQRYSDTWATKILSMYRESAPRAEQIDRVLIQLSGGKLDKLKVHSALVGSLCRYYDKNLWPRYKRIVKRSRFDREEAAKLAANMVQVVGYIQYELKF